jgi:serine phosphatase RsbU (regulator of sigma subunit)
MKLKNTLLSFLFLVGVVCSNANTIDSLLNLSQKTTNDSILIGLYNDIGSASYRVDQLLAKQYWEKALILTAQKIKGNRTKFLLKQLATANNGMGIISRRMGDLSDAMSYYQASLKINEELNNVQDIGFVYSNIGLIYRELKEYDKALEYYQKSLKLKMDNKDSVAIASCYNGLGILYRKMKDYDKALEYYNQSLALSDQINDAENVAHSYSNIGVVYTIVEDYDNALKYFKIGYELHKANNNEAGIAKYHSNMSHVYSRIGQTSKAIEEAKTAYDVYYKLGRKNDLSQVAHKLSLLYSKTKDYKKSLKHYKEYINYRDSVYNEKTTREITQKEMQFEFDKQIMADSLARAEAEKIKELEHNQELKEQRTYLYGGSFILLLVIIFSIIVFNRLKISNKQKAIIEEQKLIVETKNKEILDSITYAKRIQSAILPSINVIKESLPNSFVFYQPKDIVAGDFYWYYKKENKILIAVADCTGHGVPGAMVSVVCNNALNRAVNDFNLIDPAKILDKTASLVIDAFKKSSEDVKDGMDISLCCFDLENNKLEYAGAINSLFYVRENKLTEIKGDKQPIGQYVNIKPFTLHQLELNKGDKIYLFSDGYADQFGGEKGKKFMYKRFRDLLISISSKQFNTQENHLKQEFVDWKGDLEQVDDVCVIGIEV